MKKERDYTKQTVDSKKQYEKELLKLGIEGMEMEIFSTSFFSILLRHFFLIIRTYYHYT